VSDQATGRITSYNSRLKIVKVIWYSIVLLLLCGAALYNREHLTQFKDLARMDLATLGLVSFLFFLLQTLSGYRMHRLCKSYAVAMRPLEWFALIWVKSFFNLLPLNAGIASNAAYLKIRHGLSVTSFVNISILVAIVTTLVYAFMGLVCMGVRYLQTGAAVISLSALLLLLFAASILLLIATIPAVSSTTRLGRLINQVRESSEVIRQDKPLLRLLIFYQVLHFLLFLGIYLALFKELDYPLDLTSIAMLVIFYNLIQIVTIFPGNIGVRETVAGGVSQLLGFSFMDGMLGAVAFGLISILWDIVLGALFTLWISRQGLIHFKR